MSINLSGFSSGINVERFEECDHHFYFNESSSTNDNTSFTPRTCFIDTDQQTIDEILSGSLQNIVHSDLTCAGSGSAVKHTLFVY